ncbi:MAG: TIM barrel protein [Dehalococcoidia bacterium]
MSILPYIISAFADELGPDVDLQVSTLKRMGVQEIQLRGAWGVNVMALTVSQLADIRGRAEDAGLGFHAIGSPLGKVNIGTAESESLQGVRTAAAAAHAVGAGRVRVFSFYRSPVQSAEEVRQQVIDRLSRMCDVAEEEGVRLIHENEKDIYGDTAARCLDLFENVPSLGCCFDFANFVQVGEKPWDDCWPLLKDRVVYFDVKDAVAATGEVKPAGMGDGDVERIIADALARGFDDRFNLEPHLSAGGQFGGSTAPDLFEVAVNSLRDVLRRASPNDASGNGA